MKIASLIIGLLLAVAGLIGVCWPFPGLTLNEPYLSQYWRLVCWAFGVSDSPSLGGAFVFAWLFMTMPIGTLLLALSVPFLHWGGSR